MKITRRMFTKEANRDRAAASLSRRGVRVERFNVMDGAGTTYGLEYRPRGTTRRRA